MKNLIVVALALIPFTVAAQDVAEAVYLRRSRNLEIEVTGAGLRINEFHESEKLFHKNFEKHSREAVYYSDFDPVLEFSAETIMPKNAGQKKIKVSTIETKDIVQPGIFYGGYKRKDFVFPGIVEGAVGKLSLSKEITDPHLLTPFYFSEDIETHHAEFSVTVPATLNLRYKLFGKSTEKVDFRKEVSRDRVKYIWAMNNVPAWTGEVQAPSMSYSAPHIVFYIDSYQFRGATVKVASDVSDLYRWYASLVKQIPADNSVSLNALAKELTSGLNNDEQKIRAIFQWVQRNIKYIAFEDGMAGFVPRSATDVIAKRYGDCKDMANLLKQLINASGINAYHTWIGTRSKPYTYQDVPTAIVDNHMICSVKLNDQYIFLDATNPFVEFGMPTSMIQGKEALLGISDDKFEVVKVPVIVQAKNQRIDTLTISLEEKGVRGKMTSVMRGYRKDDLEVGHLRASLNQDKEYIRDFFEIGNNNIQIENVVLAGLGDPNVAGKASFEFFQPGYYKKVGDKLYINLSLNKFVPGERIDPAARMQPIEQDYQYEDRVTVVFDVPDNYSVTNLPSEFLKTWPEFGIRTQYKAVGRRIYFERTVFSNYLYLETTQFPVWNEFLKEVANVNAQSVVLSLSK